MAEQQKRGMVTSTNVQRNFRDIMRRVNSGEHIIIERDGVPAAVLMPVEAYEQTVATREREIAEKLQRLDELGAALREAADEQGLTEDVLIEQMRQARRAKHEGPHARKSHA